MMSVWRGCRSWKSCEIVRLRGCLSPIESLLKTTTKTTRITTAFTGSSSNWSKSISSSPTSSLPIHNSNHTVNPLISSGLLVPKPSCIIVSRGKTKKGGKREKKDYYQRQDDEDSDDYGDDDNDEEMELESGNDFRELKARIPSLRVDAILKAALNMSRNKVESAFYASRIRINEEKLLKKSYQCHLGDEVDVIKSVSKENPNTMYVSRVVLVTVGDIGEENITVKLRRYPNLLIERYKDYTPPDEDE